ncbi:MAG: NYN domain-containing protein [Clostridia bacterium]|nr:NYN domain-containing protein [Clostridia bacterium]
MKPLLVVDGYNVIGAWNEVQKYNWSIDEARDRLIHALQDFSGYADEEVVLVFDGWQSDRRITTEEIQGNVRVVFTHHGETADSYIERFVAQTPRYRSVRVATSDALEQSQVLSSGAVRMTSRELLRELREERSRGMTGHRQDAGMQRNPLEGRLPENTVKELERLRRG